MYAYIDISGPALMQDINTRLRGHQGKEVTVCFYYVTREEMHTEKKKKFQTEVWILNVSNIP